MINFIMGILLSISAEACFHKIEVDTSKIYDGDTMMDVKVNVAFGLYATKTIRLYGIDTAEIRSKDKVFAIAARDRLRELVGNCKHLRIINMGTGHFGRTLGKLYCGNRNISEQLIKEGFSKTKE